MQLFNDDCLMALKKIPDNIIDSIVTDPPAGISFMGADWDDDKGGRDEWIAWLTEVMKEAFRVLKPGAHGLVWAIPRTSHWTATALENAGFEIRDVVTHLFGSGFPKSLNISKAIDKAAGVEREKIAPLPYTNPDIRGDKFGRQDGKNERIQNYITAPSTDAAKQWDGWGTALKPASEHWILIRKPLSEKTVAENVLKWGTGGINIDDCRIEVKDQDKLAKNWDRIQSNSQSEIATYLNPKEQIRLDEYNKSNQGRFPANLILDEQAAEMLDKQSGILKIGGTRRKNTMGYSGDASRFFYVAKASSSDKNEGAKKNNHPTVKNTKLMEYLIKLISPPGGIVLDCFMGSGTAGVAAIKLGFDFIGIEREIEFFEIAKKRIDHRINKRIISISSGQAKKINLKGFKLQKTIIDKD